MFKKEKLRREHKNEVDKIIKTGNFAEFRVIVGEKGNPICLVECDGTMDMFEKMIIGVRKTLETVYEQVPQLRKEDFDFEDERHNSKRW